MCIRDRYNVSLVINDTNVISDPEAIRYGGFLAEVSEGAFQTNVLFWIGEGGKYISHNADTNAQRNWTFQWTAPSEGAGDALFTIYYNVVNGVGTNGCLLYTSPSPRDGLLSRMPSSA